MSANDMILCVEHCCNCIQHHLTTRHCERKYLEYSNLLLHSVSDFILAYGLNIRIGILRLPIQTTDRMGALEISLTYKPSTADIIRQIVYSKLESKVWPSLLSIQNAVLNRMLSMQIQLKDNYLDSSICVEDSSFPPAYLEAKHVSSSSHNIMKCADSSLSDTEVNSILFKWVGDHRQWNPSRRIFEVTYLCS